MFSQKGSQALNLMAASFNLINDDITLEDWLKHLAVLANCESAACIRWSVGQPIKAVQSTYGEPPALPGDWENRAEWIVSSAAPTGPELLDEMAARAGLLNTNEAGDIFDTDLIAACVDWEPARIFIVFARRKPGRGWAETDRARLRAFLPQVRQSILLHKKMNRLQDTLNVANKILEENPRVSISLTVNGLASRKSQQATALLNDTNCVRISAKKLSFSDSGIQAEFEEQLRIIGSIPSGQLPTFAWYRKVSDSATHADYLITLRAYFLEDWRIESSSHDRLIVMHVEQTNVNPHASIPKLRAFYELTDAQARLVAKLLNGDSIEEAAASMNVALNTARSHLRTVYSKLRVSSRSQLLQKLMATTREPEEQP
jgi:DNA-binding CsgD family transcriptional regulator